MNTESELKINHGQNSKLPDSKNTKGSTGKFPAKTHRAPKKSQLKINAREIFNMVIFFLALGVFAYVGYLGYQAYTYKPTSKVTEIKLDDNQEVIRRIDGSVHQGNDISANEGGYGRPDPFTKY